MSSNNVKDILESWDGPDPKQATATKTFYKVKKLINTTSYRIGQYLEKPEVDDMIGVLKYTVEIGPVS